MKRTNETLSGSFLCGHGSITSGGSKCFPMNSLQYGNSFAPTLYLPSDCVIYYSLQERFPQLRHIRQILHEHTDTHQLRILWDPVWCDYSSSLFRYLFLDICLSVRRHQWIHRLLDISDCNQSPKMYFLHRAVAVVWAWRMLNSWDL